MEVSKRVSLWSVEDVLEWAQDQFPAHTGTLHTAIIQHAISGLRLHIPDIQSGGWIKCSYMHSCVPGRALLRLKDYHLEVLGMESEEQQQEILQDLLLLRVQEEINELSDICSGEEAKLLYLQGVA